MLIGIEFMEEDERFSLGAILKSNTARALRQQCQRLTPDQEERIRRRVVAMLLAHNIPREFKDYFKLFKKIGIGPYQQELVAKADKSNKYVMKYIEDLGDLNE